MKPKRKPVLPPIVNADVVRKFKSKCLVNPETECVEWQDTLNDYGYGRFWDGKRNWPAHRYAYEAFVGLIPNYLTIDHLCENKACVNIKHLEPVTKKVNTQRRFSRADPNWKTPEEARKIILQSTDAKKYCSNGHLKEADQKDCRFCSRNRATEDRRRSRKIRNLRKASPEVAEIKKSLFRRNTQAK